MNKQENAKTRYYVQWDTHARHMCTVLCSLMEHQSLVDLAICCGTNTIHAHKCILAANSPYFREQLEKNAGTEQVVITGLDFAVVKSIVEFMYCGETNVLDENLKYMIAAARFFQMRGLQTLVSDHQDIRFEADSINIPAPVFLPKKPKYPNAYRPLNNNVAASNFASFKNPLQNDPYLHRKIKRKFVRSEAEKACAKEAAASRLALEALQKELASTTQISSFVIEESCTETTVENFIPHSDETFIENLNHIENVPLQVVNYDDLNTSLLAASQMINMDKSECSNNILQYGIQTSTTKDKLKRILGTDIPGNVEIMFRTSDGNFVNVTDDVLQNLSGGTLQYQIVDENGQVGEIRELQVQEQNNSTMTIEEPKNTSLENSITHQSSTTESLLTNENEECTPCSSLDLPNLQGSIGNQNNEIVCKLETVKADSQIIDLCNQRNDGDENLDKIDNACQEDDLINIISSSSSSSPGKGSDNTSSSDSKIDESDSFIAALSKSSEPANEKDDCIMFENYSADQFLNVNQEEFESKENKYEKDAVEPELCFTDCKSKILKDSTQLDNQNLETICSGAHSDVDVSYNYNFESSVYNANEICNDLIDGGGGDTVLNSSERSELVKDIDDTIGDSKHFSKKARISQIENPMEGVSSWQTVDVEPLDTYSPRKTRSRVKTIEVNSCHTSSDECKEAIEDVLNCNLKLDKPRRIMPSRKKRSV